MELNNQKMKALVLTGIMGSLLAMTGGCHTSKDIYIPGQEPVMFEPIPYSGGYYGPYLGPFYGPYYGPSFGVFWGPRYHPPHPGVRPPYPGPVRPIGPHPGFRPGPRPIGPHPGPVRPIGPHPGGRPPHPGFGPHVR